MKAMICPKQYSLVLGSLNHVPSFMHIRQDFKLIYVLLFYLFIIIILGGHMESLCGKLQL